MKIFCAKVQKKQPEKSGILGFKTANFATALLLGRWIN